MKRHEFLRGLHKASANRNYLEIGVNDGRSLTFSRVPSIAIDPAFKVVSEIRCDVHLAKATSDDFFARENPLQHLKGGRHPLRKCRPDWTRAAPEHQRRDRPRRSCRGTPTRSFRSRLPNRR